MLACCIADMQLIHIAPSESWFHILSALYGTSFSMHLLTLFF